MQFDQLKRREFITLLGGAVVWPLAAHARQPERMRRVGVLMNTAADDPEGQARVTAFLDGMAQLGWIDGRNMRIDTRWAADDADLYRRYAPELVALDVKNEMVSIEAARKIYGVAVDPTTFAVDERETRRLRSQPQSSWDVIINEDTLTVGLAPHKAG